MIHDAASSAGGSEGGREEKEGVSSAHELHGVGTVLASSPVVVSPPSPISRDRSKFGKLNMEAESLSRVGELAGVAAGRQASSASGGEAWKRHIKPYWSVD